MNILNQLVMTMIQPVKVLNQHLKVLIQHAKTLNQEPNRLIQARCWAPEIIVINQRSYNIV